VEHGYSHPHATKSGDGDAGDDTDLDAFECANGDASTRPGYQYASACTSNTYSGLYGWPGLERRRMCLPTGQARLDGQSMYS
jgi:hypothetical protein